MDGQLQAPEGLTEAGSWRGYLQGCQLEARNKAGALEPHLVASEQ